MGKQLLIRLITVLCFAFLFVFTISVNAEEQDGFSIRRGLKWGLNIQQVKESEDLDWYTGAQGGNFAMLLSDGVQIGDYQGYITCFFLDDSLEAIMYFPKGDSYDTLLKAMEQKYGTIHESDKDSPLLEELEIMTEGCYDFVYINAENPEEVNDIVEWTTEGQTRIAIFRLSYGRCIIAYIHESTVTNARGHINGTGL